MRACIQRVTSAAVVVEGETVGKIGRGLLVLLGVGDKSCDEDAKYLVEKIINLRIFADDQGKMNRSLQDVAGSLLVVSQFTLYGDTRKGRRPSFVKAAGADEGKRLYELFCTLAAEQGVPVETGIFQADMQVSLVNDGPVTLLLSADKSF